VLYHQITAKTDGTLWTWGSNSYGQLGDNSVAARSSPIQIPGTTWASTGRGYHNSFAVKTDGTLWVWGKNTYGVLGVNATPNAQYSSPVQIPGTTWTGEVGGGERQSYGIKTDGTLWVWGSNAHGSLGQNNLVEYSSPVQIPGTTWSKAVASKYQCGAIRTDGTLWIWGDNEWGEGGHNNRTQYSSPMQVPGTTWNNIDFGMSHGFGVKTDGTLWSWGYNGDGNLGLNGPHNVKISSPTQVPGTTWSEVAAGRYHALALKTNGTLWAWGDNEEGELGQNALTMLSSPVQVGSGSEWIAISATFESSYAIEKDTTP